MSFMFRPLEYDDWSAVNNLNLSQQIIDSLIVSNDKIVEKLKGENKSLHVDGYIGANFENLVSLLKKELKEYKFFDMSKYTKTQEEIINITKSNLPLESEKDPVKLFGKLFTGSLEDLYDENKISELIQELNSTEKYVLYGYGSSMDSLIKDREKTLLVYMDVTPKNTAVRARNNKFTNIGFDEVLEFNELMRRNYYVDFEVVVKQRKKLLTENRIDYYVDANFDNEYKMIEMKYLNQIFIQQSKVPFRCKPVYLEGIWGGEFIRKIRHLPMDISSNVAWIFEFIPMEVSIVFRIGDYNFEVPFSTFLSYSGEDIIGSEPYKVFDGYFPVRFNYDDTYHSNGNMSIQVHPPKDVTQKEYGEKFSQDEAYYVIATGHHAKTYLGFKDDINPDEFMKLAAKSHKEGINIDYKEYVNAENSEPGKQFMIPAGTIHSSGRNQLILELGSLTVGSYTYKIYDYNRKQKDGSHRPIHLKMANEVLDFKRTSSWVKKNIAIEPRLVDEGEKYKELVVGDTDLMYYETSRVELEKNGVYEGKNNHMFTTITVVDGEAISVYDKDHPDRKYDLNFLEIATIPSTIENYVIENKGYQPVVIHKTYLKKNFEKYV